MQLGLTDEQRAFRRLGVLPGLFPVDAAEAVLTATHDSRGGSDALRLVSGLIDKSLLQRSEATVVATRPLYLMLDTMRAYATNELDAAGERDDARQGLGRYFPYYNEGRQHQALDYRTPAAVYRQGRAVGR